MLFVAATDIFYVWEIYTTHSRIEIGGNALTADNSVLSCQNRTLSNIQCGNFSYEFVHGITRTLKIVDRGDAQFVTRVMEWVEDDVFFTSSYIDFLSRYLRGCILY